MTTLLSRLALAAALAVAAPVVAQPVAKDAGADAMPALGAGVSRELAAWRAARVRDVRYDLALDVTRPDTATGRVTVRFVRRGDGDAVLDFRGLALSSVQANGRALPDVRGDGAHVRVPAAALRVGENTVTLDFAAAIAPAGASVIRYRDATDGADYLYTLLVPSDANALFPCFDQPDLKARVTLSLRVPAAWTAVANGPAVADSVAGEDRLLRFAETRPISTYLVAFAAGPWHVATRTVGGRTISLYSRASRAREVEVDSLIDANARALAWLTTYFGRPYPFAKYDMVLAPAFPFGGMEHPGAVFYNEESFVYRERPTQPQRIGRTATIYHEVAHQWFGDLVTMRWFDDLWLKEGFATYMAARMQAALDPASEAWKTFYLRNKPTAYAVDASLGTTPVWQELGNLDQAKSNYGAIVYNKAPSVLKQLEYVVGERAFRDGVRRFLARHAYANATWRDLLAAVGEASGRDLSAWGAQYILRPGLPVLEATAADGGVTITQRAAQDLSGGDPWPIRAELLVKGDGASQLRRPVTLAGRTTRVPVAPDAAALLFPNAGDHAYALTLLDSGSVRWAERHLGDARDVGDALLRAQLWGALWDLAREARYAPTRFLALAQQALPTERDEQIAGFVLARVTRAATRWLGPAQRDSVLPALEAVLARAADDTTRPYGIRKAHLDALVSVAQTPAALTALDARLDSATAAGAPLRGPTRWAIVTTLVARGAPTAERRLAEESRRDSTSEGKRRAFVAGAARADSAVKRAYFARYFADRALNEEWVTASLGAFVAPGHEALVRPYVAPALDSLPWIQRNRRIFFLGSWLDALVGGQGTAGALAEVDDFLRTHPTLPADLRRKILQSADELRRTVAVRAAFAR
ncbi:M1 family metallopeptidase [Roseisolibacter agri]|uniref:Aminopeptidase N n=1 Tax=Roseisolibacter agri TaxID=2014610 RepID=A0AA37V4T2_9BACT|nr:M1 family aminopeptidase [Roseisolibacter agri]GLC28332.1 aminopeptidase [Roseisolibacter agri]